MEAPCSAANPPLASNMMARPPSPAPSEFPTVYGPPREPPATHRSEPSSTSGSAMSHQDRHGQAVAQLYDENGQAQQDRDLEEARRVAKIDLTNQDALCVSKCELEKQRLKKTIQDALEIKTFTGGGLDLSRKVPKVMFLFMIVGCEIDVYGFIMAFNSYWALGIFPLHFFLVAMPVGYCVATGMLWCYSKNPEKEEANKYAKPARPARVPAAPTENPYTREMNLRGGRMFAAEDWAEEVANRPDFEPLELKLANSKETVKLKYYHFLPIFRFYMVVKDQNPHDVEGLFRVNSLSSFTLGVAQLAGMAFARGLGVPFDLFMKVNVASQVINWSITFLYFATSIASRMKASFKVDILMDNSVTLLRDEYESYLAAVQDFQKGGGGSKQKAKMRSFHESLNHELSEFVNQPLNTEPLSMKDKIVIRRAIHRRMYGAYSNIN